MVATYNFPAPFESGFRLHSGDYLNKVIAADVVSAANGLTALSGGGQTGATQLVTVINRVTTVAGANDSVQLPPAVIGASVSVDNDGASNLAVYPNGTDQIEDSTNFVVLIPGEDATFVCPAAGKWYQLGTSGQFSGTLAFSPVTNGITAHSGGGQGSAVPLTSPLNRITTVAAGNDSVLLPPSTAGAMIVVTNAAAANAAAVFPTGTEQINVITAGSAFSLAANKTAIFFCAVAGNWNSVLTA